MKKITIGIIAHVDSGKTTLSEAILFHTNVIRSFGRVDKGASFFDNDSLERIRGITIYSKQAMFSYGDTNFTLIDTPGHSDFGAETERALQVLDYAVLLVSAADGIKGQSETLWRLLKEYNIPTFIFFNKMDQDGANKEFLMNSVKSLSKDCAVDFSSPDSDEFYDRAAMCSEEAMEEYLESGCISKKKIIELISERKLFPCLFGSALLMEGTKELLSALDEYTKPPVFSDQFSARVYKISQSEDNLRLTFIKIMGGQLKNKSLLPDGEDESKINQIRFYSGNKYILKDVAVAGDVCALTGLTQSYAGQGFGALDSSTVPLIMPVLSYRVILPPNEDAVKVLPTFRKLEEENPELSVLWNEEKKEIHVSVMGRVQLEILTTVLKNRFNLPVSFDVGEVMYRETITKPVIGVGHFEPLRHYAEVHLLMEPLPLGSGLIFDTALSSDRLAKNWQRLILTHLAERVHKGVLTGAPITDMKITLVNGKSHLKHTEGGDFRQAVYRAVRQGLMMTESALLEPFYRFTLEVPKDNTGRALNDLGMMNAQFSSPDLNVEKGTSVITGRASVSALKDYPTELATYSKGQGSLTVFADGYGPCHNAEDVIAQKAYDPLHDVKNTPDSVFCSHGSGIVIPYNEVYDHMHLSFDGKDSVAPMEANPASARTVSDIPLGTEEVDAIIASFTKTNVKDNKNSGKKFGWKKNFGDAKGGAGGLGNGVGGFGAGGRGGAELAGFVKSAPGIAPFAFEDSQVVIVDGYNVIFAWDELKKLATENIDAARDKLIQYLSKLKSMMTADVIAVFDAYRVKDHACENYVFEDVRVVFTGEDITADQYIERFTNSLASKAKVTVVTSDGPEQIITRGHGCKLISSREFKNRIDDMSTRLNEKYNIQ